MTDVSQVERQLYILSLLSENHRGYTTEEILNSLHRVGIDVSLKTVERDIDYITANFFVYEDERDGKTVYQANKYSVQHISFTISELISLHFAREVINSYSGLDVGATGVKILDKLIATAPQINRSYIETLSEMMKVYVSGITPEKDLNPEYLNVIRDAIAERKSLQLEYYSFNSDETTKRKFDPYLLEIQEGCWHVVGYCHLRNGIRDFRVSRIKSLMETKDSFERPDNFYEQYKKDRFEKLAGEEKVKLKLRFTGDAARFVKEYESSKADSIQEDGASLIFERTVTMTPEIVKWVLSFGAGVEVLEPESLRDEIKEHIQKLAEIYI
jgi:proteasome accessory factor B